MRLSRRRKKIAKKHLQQWAWRQTLLARVRAYECKLALAGLDDIVFLRMGA